ncbi:hypothetical protein PR202_gb15323 [Eleusine coracana subsp. coracana]|uniref:Uncharacterized protein n=1 Tax=Eleusine coracana subsp. coracana TaxID=191504 RepID=A0AAV5EVB3_ELECO|nr:hypothetical protein PR202_gb15323 [Eleusine coracana subsp. coracana]
MCMLSGKREHVGCFLLVVLVIALIIGVLFGLGVFRHGYEHRPPTIRFRRAWRNKAKEPATLADAMCKFSLKKQHVGGFLLVILVIALIIGVLFGLGIFKHGYERVRDMGRNHTCYDCNTA